MESKTSPIQFINEAIEPIFDNPPLLEKKPGCPDGFTWRGVDFRITALHKEWHDYQRRGRMARNMRPTHAATASMRGSWGVGQDYYRVDTDQGRLFDIYYDRAPKNVDKRKGNWFIFQELQPRE